MGMDTREEKSMSKVYINPETGQKARLLNDGTSVILYGRFGKRMLSKCKKELAGEDPGKYWNRYLKKRGFKTMLELKLKGACEQ
jgi:hypothetical protein